MINQSLVVVVLAVAADFDAAVVASLADSC